MPKCKILETFQGSQDGRITETFEKDDLRELSDSLAQVAIENKLAQRLGRPKTSGKRGANKPADNGEGEGAG